MLSFFFDNSTVILTAAALIPAIVLLVMIYLHDKIEKEPIGLLALLLLVGGGLSVVFAVIGEGILQSVLNRFVSPYGQEILYNVLMAFIVVACVEEGGKLLFLKLFSWKSPHFNFVFDAVVYSAFVSLGFAAIENVKYVFAYGMEVAIARAITAVPAHLSFSILMGVFYGRAKLCQVYGSQALTKKNMILAYERHHHMAVPPLCHRHVHHRLPPAAQGLQVRPSVGITETPTADFNRLWVFAFNTHWRLLPHAYSIRRRQSSSSLRLRRYFSAE